MRAPAVAPPTASRVAFRHLVRLLAVLEGGELSLWRRRGLTLTQMRALYRISATGTATCGEVSEHLHMQPPATSGLLARLVQRGLVERGARAGDRRVVEMRLTAAGLEAVGDIAEWRKGGLGRSLDRLDDGELTQLSAVVEHLTTLLEADEADTAMRTRSEQ
ncbi:MAG: MarR family transcriptional regulator [Candidatus Dormibacteraeota bacterium]|nr:MarR family transcriptional regulator [Candidatus Dormibacteraeota bacterium]